MISNLMAPSIQPRNALIVTVPQPAPAYRQPPNAPSNLPVLLANTIGHAALLSDTPAKWASTIGMLRQNGVDPDGYEDFEKGRQAAMAAAGTKAPQEETE
ncbi:MAG: hypothetical protein ACLPWS_06740 [Rhodomicrobium sp.]